MKRSSLVWYLAVACLGGSLCVGPVVKADSPTPVKAGSTVPTAVTTQVQLAQPVNNTVANNVVSNGAATQVDQAALKQKQQY